MKLFGQSLVTVRLCGGLFLLLTAILVFAISQRFADELAAGIASSAMIAATTVNFGFWTSTELLAIFFLTAGLALMVFRGENLWSAFCVGVCLSCATLVRTNVAFAVVAVGMLYVAGSFSTFLRLHRYGSLAYVLGGMLPLGAVLLVYAASGHLDLFILSTVKVAWSYSSTQMSIEDALYYTVRNTYVTSRTLSGFGFFVAAAIIGTAAAFRSLLLNYALPGVPPLQRRDIVIVTTVFAADAFSIIASGAAFPHYLLMLYPFGAIATAIGTRYYLFARIRHLSYALALAAIAVAFLVDTRYAISAVAEFNTTQSSYPIRRIANAIASDQRPGDKVWALSHHLVLFYLNEPPVSPLVHPLNLFSEAIKRPLIEAGYIPEYEFQRIIKTAPRYIVCDAGDISGYIRGWEFLIPVEYGYELKKLVDDNYELWVHSWYISVYRRKSLPKAAEAPV